LQMSREKASLTKFLGLTIGIVCLVFILTYVISIQWSWLSVKAIETGFNEFARSFGLPGLFIASLIANATILLPLPIDLVIPFFANVEFFGLGVLSPMLVALVVALGAAIGEMSGYLIGFLGVKSIEKMKREEIKQIVEKEKEINRYGSVVVFIAALTPIPFDLIGIASGLIKFDVKRFFLACFLGKLARYALLAYLGLFFLDGLLRFLGSILGL